MYRGLFVLFHKGLDCLDRIPDIPPDFDAAELPLLCQAPHHAGGTASN